jgi:murein DD-endopeptidase MepM/ murein hydrolase activator NlpD
MSSPHALRPPRIRSYGGAMRRLPTLIQLLTAISAALAFLAAPATARAAWVWPVSGDVITPYRNGTDPYASGQHRGIDIAAPIGTRVVAAAGGDVRFAGTAGSSGLTISIRTGDGYDSSYLHLSSLAVRAGARVAAGERIGAVGISGTRSAIAPHLHFGVRDAGTRHAYHDPLNFLPPPAAAPRPSPPAGAPAPAPRPAQPVAAPVPAPGAAPHPDLAPRPDPVTRRQGAPHPLRAPHRSPSPQYSPRPRPMPRSSPTPLPAPASGPRSVTAPHPTHAPHPMHPTHSTPASHPTPAHAEPAPHRFPTSEGALHPRDEGKDRVPASTSDAGHSAQPRLAEARGAEAAAHHRSVSDSKQRSRLNLGWALACGGLLLAAGILGMTPEGRRTRARTRTRAPTAALRPLTGRR